MILLHDLILHYIHSYRTYFLKGKRCAKTEEVRTKTSTNTLATEPSFNTLASKIVRVSARERGRERGSKKKRVYTCHCARYTDAPRVRHKDC